MRKALFFTLLLIVAVILLGTQSAYMNLSHISGYATTMIHLNAWKAQGISHLHFSPSYTQGNIGDQFVQFYQGPVDQLGNCYYTSFPPGALWISYLWVNILPLEISLALGLLNSILFIATLLALGIWGYQILGTQNQIARQWLIPSGLLLIGLTPLFLFFFSTYYFIENISLCLTVWSSYYLWKISQQEFKEQRDIWIAIIFMTVLSLCESIGFFYGAVLIYLLYRNGKNIKWPLIVFSACALLIFSIYASIDGVFAILRETAIRFLGRSGWTSDSIAENGATLWNGGLLQSGFIILKTLASPIIFLSLSAIMLWFISKRRNESTVSSKGILIALAPIIIHLILFLNANLQHHQLLIKALIIAWPILMIGFSNKGYVWSLLFVGASYLSFVQLGYRFDYKQLEEERYVEQFANAIKEESKEQQILLKCSKSQVAQIPVLIYFSGRNIAVGNTSIKGKIKPRQHSIAVDSFWHPIISLLH
ncbi:MAG: hypothetical protein ORN56_09175 [Chitinophagales bacterium]|nr:hypothetical protein [Chitinophagales bacterium]